jgi:predicted SpoU family rRNA methylase
VKAVKKHVAIEGVKKEYKRGSKVWRCMYGLKILNVERNIVGNVS